MLHRLILAHIYLDNTVTRAFETISSVQTVNQLCTGTIIQGGVQMYKRYEYHPDRLPKVVIDSIWMFMISENANRMESVKQR